MRRCRAYNPFFTLPLNHPLTQDVKRMDEVCRYDAAITNRPLKKRGTG